jgi:hypothetical protein
MAANTETVTTFTCDLCGREIRMVHMEVTGNRGYGTFLKFPNDLDGDGNSGEKYIRASLTVRQGYRDLPKPDICRLCLRGFLEEMLDMLVSGEPVSNYD